MRKNPYRISNKATRMIPSIVCYADILGYKSLCKEALDSENGDLFLERLRDALSIVYRRVRKYAKDFSGNDSTLYSIKIFTDNIVIGFPVRNYNFDSGEPELGMIFSILAEYQARLAVEGFFLRGGIAYGKHYMDDDIVYGSAFLDAVSLDTGGGAPRIVLADSTKELIRQQLRYYGDSASIPHYRDLLEDADGAWFLNYLDEAFIAFPDDRIFLEIIKGHQQAIIAGLSKYREFPGIRAKFEWAARYHNFICSEFTERYPGSFNPNANEEYGVISEEAHKLLDYLIDIESFSVKPKRISLPLIR